MDIPNWEAYFEEVYSFLSSLGGGRRSFANQAYTEYVMERLRNCIRSLSILTDHIHPIEDLEIKE